MQIRLVQHPLQLQRRLNVDERTVDQRDLAHQLVAREHYVDVFSLRRMEQRFREPFLQPRTLLVCSVRSQQVSAQNQEQREDEYEKRLVGFFRKVFK